MAIKQKYRGSSTKINAILPNAQVPKITVKLPALVKLKTRRT